MAKGNFAACLADVLVQEGGYVDHPKDPRGATNLGITHWHLDHLALPSGDQSRSQCTGESH